MPRPTTLPPISAKQQQEQVSEGIEQFELPKSLVTKIAKSAVPPEVKLQKDVVLSLVKSSTVFINFLAATAHDIAISKQHKSISASDVLKALEAVEFGDLVDPLQKQLKKYRSTAKSEKKRAAKGKSAAAAAAASAPAPAAGGPLSISITLPPKGKDKGKAKEVSVSAPGPGPASDAMEVDEEVADVKDDEIVEEEEDEAEIEEEPEDVMDEDEEEDELVDTVALEEEELRKDAKGLDEVGMKDREDGV
ncbi:DNA polymerase Epsilon Subunit [Pleurotus pulmonarius]